MNTNHSIRMQVLCALFAAVCAVCSQLTIPIQPVPITLGTFGVLMAGGFLGKRYGLLALLIYLILGAAGVPVFSMMRAGISVLAGPSADSSSALRRWLSWWGWYLKSWDIPSSLCSLRHWRVRQSAT